MLIILMLILIIFSNQYLLINEEFFIILAFFALCYIVKTNLGSIVENELNDRKTKVLASYLEYLNKKSKYYNINISNINQKVNYLSNYAVIQQDYFNKFMEFFQLSKNQALLELNTGLESSMVSYFAVLVSNKRKFL